MQVPRFRTAMQRMVAHCRVEHKHPVCDGGVAMHQMLALSHVQDIEHTLFRLPRTTLGTEMQGGSILRPSGLRVENPISVCSDHPLQELRIICCDEELVR